MFNHTHTIKIVDGSGLATRIEVDADARGPVEAGPLYTRQEAETCTAADWEMVEGELHFQGQPASLYRVGATVTLVEIVG
jgi:hypothetical protein